MKINKALGIYNIGRVPDKWRKSIVVPFYKKEKTEGGIYNCANYQAIKLMSHAIKLRKE